MENFVLDRQESVGRDIESISDFFLRNWSLKFKSEGDTSVEREYETLKSEKAKTTSKTSKGSLQDARDKSKNQGKRCRVPN